MGELNMEDPISRRAWVLFRKVSDLPAGERAACLARECQDHPQLRAEVETLLKSLEEAGSFLESPALADRSIALDLSIHEMIGRSVGPFRVERVVSSGGMGVVYEASQETPHRRVALKVLRPGMASAETLRRFEFEAEVLARLRHPGIAQIFQAGTYRNAHGSEQPYFAMEFVPDALTVTEYAARHGLNTAQRVELFARVADAVHHGHQKGIIHRDLKPGNILVDPGGDPKVIDFGVARSTDGAGVWHAAQTAMGQLIGTPAYMSPEQCAADFQALDVRSDVYSLGVVLYELLTGVLPHDLEGLGLLESAQVIRDRPVRRPCSVRRDLGRDLEAVLLKALARERDHRYPSASELAADLRRYLRMEPVQAQALTTFYQLSMFARRNRSLVASLGLLFLVMVVATIVSTVSLQSARREANQRLLAERAEARKAAEALESAALAAGVNAFLRGTLSQANPRENPGARGTTIREAIDVAAGRLRPGFGQNPKVEALVRQVLAEVYLDLGDPVAAEEHARRAWDLLRDAVGPLREEALRISLTLGRVLVETDQIGEAVDRLVGLAEQTRSDAPDSLLRMDTLCLLGQAWVLQQKPEAARAVLEEAIACGERLGPVADDHLGLSYQNLSAVWSALGNPAAAEQAVRQALQLRRRVHGEFHAVVSESLNTLSELQQAQGRVDEAEATAREVLRIRQEIYPQGHPSVARSLNNLAARWQAQGRLEEAESLLREAVVIWRTIWPEGHPDLYAGILNHADVLHELERFTEADRLYIEACERIRAASPDPPDRLEGVALEKRAFSLNAQPARKPEAVALLKEAVAVYRRLPRPDPESLGRALNSLATVLEDLGEWTAAERTYREALAELTGVEGGEAQLLRSRGLLGALLEERAASRGNPRAAADLLLEACGLHLLVPDLQRALRAVVRARSLLREEQPPRPLEQARARSLHGACLVELVHFQQIEASSLSEAEDELLDAYAELVDNPAADDRDRHEAALRVVRLYEVMEEPDEVEAWRQRLEVGTRPPQ